jgi:hypothetical protein
MMKNRFHLSCHDDGGGGPSGGRSGEGGDGQSESVILKLARFYISQEIVNYYNQLL